MEKNLMPPHIPNGLGHFDIAGADIESLAAFYGQLFGWAVDPKGPGYALLRTPDGSANGALIENESAALTIGIVVPDLDATLAATIVAGGDIIMPATDNGWVKKAVLADPAGNALTVIQA
jgi:predicted enzyme related to lactoylglutathione lyase